MTLKVIDDGKVVVTVLNVADKKRINQLKDLFKKQYIKPKFKVLSN